MDGHSPHTRERSTRLSFVHAVPRIMRQKTCNSTSQLCLCSSASRHGNKPRTVGIAGAGIAGLAAALALLKTPATGVEAVTMFEPRDSLDFGLGGALNINGGAAILSKQYSVDLRSIARPMSFVTARDTTGSILFEVDVEEQVTANSRAREWLMQDGNHLFMTVMRDSLQALLFAELQKYPATIHRGPGNKVINVLQSDGKAHFVLSSGEQSAPFDLVIGADGIRSSVRNFVAPATKPPQYSGIRVQWAIAPPNRCDLRQGQIEQWFGDGGYVLRFAAGPADGLREMLAVSFREAATAKENVDYASEEQLREDCERRLISLGMPESVRSVCTRSTQFIETGVYYHAEMSSWSRGGNCILVGDSAHAMPPFLGQGANQAIQDAHALAQALSSIGRDLDCLQDALKRFENIRRPPTVAILESSRVIGILETLGGPVGMAARNTLFRLAGLTGTAGQTLVQAALPRVS